MPRFWDLLPASAWPTQPFIPPFDPTQAPAWPPAALPPWNPATPSAYGWPTVTAASASAPRDAASVPPWNSAMPQASAAPAGTTGNAGTVDDDPRVAEAKRAYDFATWFFGPPSAPQSPSMRAAAPLNASPLPGDADQSAAPPVGPAQPPANGDLFSSLSTRGLTPKPGQTIPEKTTPVATQAGTADQLVDFVNKFDLPMDAASRLARARKMGFRPDMPFDYDAGETFNALRNASKTGHTTAEELSAPGVSAAVDPAAAADRASTAPRQELLWHRADRPREIDLKGDESLPQVLETLRGSFDRGHDAVILNNYTAPGEQAGQKFIIVRDGNQLRSPQAAFDRAKKFSPDLLAGLATGAVVVPAADLMRQRQH
jgi:hypothetical protein